MTTKTKAAPKPPAKATPKPAAKKAAKKADAKPAPPWAARGDVVTVLLKDLDTAPAAAVRAAAEPADEYVESLIAAYESGTPPPPPQTFGYKDGGKVKYFLADGGNRIAAHKKSAIPKAECVVVMCDTREDAEKEAFAFALRANTQHGLRRTTADLQAAARSALARPEVAGLSDTKVDALIGASRGYISKLKRDTGRPSQPDPDEVVGSRKFRADDLDDSLDTPSEPRPGGTPTHAGSGPNAAPESPLVDAVGRVVPEDLRPVFAARTAFRHFRRAFPDAVLALAREWSAELAEFARTEPGGGAVPAILPDVEAFMDKWLAQLSHGLGGLKVATPHVVCQEAHEAGKTCPRCLGRGWLSRGLFEQLGPRKHTYGAAAGAAD